MINGLATNIVGINFDEVGKVNIQLQDTTWAAVDINNADTSADCSANGAYVCGDVNATFIPDHFTLTNAHLQNNRASTFTYLSNDLNISSGFDVTIEARNAKDGKTSNFDSASWENPVNMTFTLPVIGAMTEHKSEITTTQKLGFGAGTKTINYSDTNASANLTFNYVRDSSVAINPFVINGSSVDINASSLYASSTGATATVIGGVKPDQNVTFIYGRTNAPRQKFIDDATASNHDAFIYYEAYCDAVGCPNALLPDGTLSTFNDDPRWFINTQHASTDGNASNVQEKKLSGDVEILNANQPTGNHPDKMTVKYTGGGYPYLTTMENNASSWLLYDKYNAGAQKNEFILEFYKDSGGYVGSGKSTSDVNVTRSNTLNVNENKSWW